MFTVSANNEAWLNEIELATDAPLNLSVVISALGQDPMKICKRATRWAQSWTTMEQSHPFAIAIKQDIRQHNEFRIKSSPLPFLNPTAIEAQLIHELGRSNIGWKNPVNLEEFVLVPHYADSSISSLIGLGDHLDQQMTNLTSGLALTGELFGSIHAADLFCDLLENATSASLQGKISFLTQQQQQEPVEEEPKDVGTESVTNESDPLLSPLMTKSFKMTLNHQPMDPE